MYKTLKHISYHYWLCVTPPGNRGGAICASKGAAMVLHYGGFCNGCITKRCITTNVSYE